MRAGRGRVSELHGLPPRRVCPLRVGPLTPTPVSPGASQIVGSDSVCLDWSTRSRVTPVVQFERQGVGSRSVAPQMALPDGV